MEENRPVENNLSRRDALKALVATGGALAAAAFVPGKWTKPVIEGGVVPAHAQSTLPPLTVTVVEACRDLQTTTITYNDPAGLVTNDAHVVIYVPNCGDAVYDGPLSGVFASGDGFSGSMGLEFGLNCTINNLDTLCVQFFVGARYADDCGPFDFCAPG
jgi:hypothetical protein